MGQFNDRIDALAALWAAKVAGGKISPDDQRCLDIWLAEDIRHLGAFARAQAILLRVDRLRAIGPEALRAAVPTAQPSAELSLPAVAGEDLGDLDARALTLKAPVLTRRRALMTGTAAASLALASLIADRTILADRSAKLPTASPVERYATERGETRKVRLADGSEVTLNTNSLMTVNYTQTVRAVRLEHGEALFKVAKNKARPFVVTAADALVRAVGTAFTVRMLPHHPVQVLVQEGVVEVSHRDGKATGPVRAVADTRTVVDADASIAVRAIPRVEVERNLAWQRGQISFENVRLSDAAQEFARYSGTRITVDPAVANRTITGMFASNDPVGFAKIAATVLDLHVEVETSEVWIVR